MAKVRFGQQPDNPSPTCAEVVRLILGQEVAGLVRYGPRASVGHDPEAVHQLRVKSRRLRSELEIVAPAIKSSALREFRSELRWVGGVLGRQRDLDVLYLLLNSLSDQPSAALDESMLVAIDILRNRESEQVQRMIRSKRYRELVRTLRAAVVKPPLRTVAAQPASLVLRPGLENTLSELFKTADRFGPSPTSLELHHIRILSKRGRYCSEVASTYLGERATNLATALAEVQGVLGTLHDQIGAITYLSAQRVKFERDFTLSAASEAPGAAILWLTGSVTRLLAQWREPLEWARVMSEELMDYTPSSPLFGRTDVARGERPYNAG
jgi:CHAD domain-containing protein